MQILKIVLQGIGETLMLRFKTKKSAEYYRHKIHAAMETTEGTYPSAVEIEDDYGLCVKIPPYGVLLIQLIDFEKAMEGDATNQYIQKKIQDRVFNRLMVEHPIIEKPFQ